MAGDTPAESTGRRAQSPPRPRLRPIWIPVLVAAGLLVLAVTGAAAGRTEQATRAAMSVIGFWGISLTVGIGAGWLLFEGGRRIAGDRAAPGGFRTAAIAVALLIASVFAQAAAGDTARMAARVARALVFETPIVIFYQQDQGPPLQPILDCLQGVRICGSARPDPKAEANTGAGTPGAAPAGQRLAAPPGADPAAGAAVAKDFICSVPGAPDASALDADCPRPLESDSSDWARLFGITLALLLLARALGEAFRNYPEQVKYDVEEQAARRAGPKALEEFSRTPPPRPLLAMMSFPRWVALLIYAAILIPASYLATGALLYTSTDQAATDLAALSTQLDEIVKEERRGLPDAAGAAATGDLDARFLGAMAAPPETTGPTSLPRTPENLEGRFSQLKEQALLSARNAQARASARDFSEYTQALRASFRTELLEAQQEARYCAAHRVLLRDDGAVRAGPRGAPAPARPAGETATATPPATPTPPVDAAQGPATTQPGVASAPAPSPSAAAGQRPPADQALDARAARACAPVPLEDPFVGLATVFFERQGADFARQLYGWLAESPDSTVTIVGLVGFGLFGAAIRMMGRPGVTDRRSVFLELREARKLHERALEEKKRDLDRLRLQLQAQDAAAGASPPTPEAIQAAEQSVDAAQTTYTEAMKKEQEAQAALVPNDDDGASATADPAEERYNVVYRNAQGRFVVGGAAARVFVQGVGAAFTVFLAGKAGTRLLASDDVSPHPFGLLLFCFVGAVFAEEIWKAAAHMLRTRTATPSNGG